MRSTNSSKTSSHDAAVSKMVIPGIDEGVDTREILTHEPGWRRPDGRFEVEVVQRIGIASKSRYGPWEVTLIRFSSVQGELE